MDGIGNSGRRTSESKELPQGGQSVGGGGGQDNGGWRGNNDDDDRYKRGIIGIRTAKKSSGGNRR